MKIIVFLVIFGMLSFKSLGQIPPINEPCDFWKELSFKNGRDTVLVWGKYIACTRIHHSDVLKSLGAQNKLNIKDFTYGVHFLPRGCKNEQGAECSDTTGVLFQFDPVTYDKEVLYRCIFFEGLYKDKEKRKPYFIVDKTIVQ